MLADWWNGIELWVLRLPFPFQFALVIAILAPLCLVVAWAIDRVVDHASAWFGPSDSEPIGQVRQPEEHTEQLVDSISS